MAQGRSTLFHELDLADGPDRIHLGARESETEVMLPLRLVDEYRRQRREPLVVDCRLERCSGNWRAFAVIQPDLELSLGGRGLMQGNLLRVLADLEVERNLADDHADRLDLGEVCAAPDPAGIGDVDQKRGALALDRRIVLQRQ